MSYSNGVVAAFDTVNALFQNKESKRLNLSFAYIHLQRALDAFDAVEKKIGYTDIYFNAKKNILEISTS